jgi:uncharacterized protein with PIN domain
MTVDIPERIIPLFNNTLILLLVKLIHCPRCNNPLGELEDSSLLNLYCPYCHFTFCSNCRVVWSENHKCGGNTTTNNTFAAAPKVSVASTTPVV